MLFNTFEFAAFFAVVFALYHALDTRRQNLLLLGASYFFYGWWDWRFLGLLLLSTVVDYTVGRLIPQVSARARKRLLLLSLATNLGILGFFKYFNFFIDSTAHMLERFGLEPNLPLLSIVLPVGISFYTFQTLAYTIDVYQARVSPTRDFVVFAVYVGYFPQLVAGPIERAQNLIPQFSRARRVTADKLASGAFLFFIGFTRKVLIADQAAPFVDAAFRDPANADFPTVLCGAFLFGIQIYADFSGYTDMARGVSRMLGIELMENFAHPYSATNITDFWRRWHMSLSSWLRDYLYIPLGGNRKGRVRTYVNLMLTMLLGGLWHGAAWTFVIWGGLHGAALAIHKVFSGQSVGSLPRIEGRGRDVVKWIPKWAATMLLVWCAWVFFRASDFATAFAVFETLSQPTFELLAHTLRPAYWITIALLFLDLPQKLGGRQEAVLGWPWPVRGVYYAAAVIALVLYGESDEIPFIYFQF